MMRFIKPVMLALAALGTVLAAPPALAWGSLGHRTVAAIAWANVRPQTRVQIDALLRQTRTLNTPECAVRTLADASTWADCVRKDGDRFRFASRWHFQNEDICRAYDPQEDCAGGNCVTAQIDRDRMILAQPGKPVAERVQALMFLVHFVGDIHQPLHSADHARDRGGNDLLVAGGQFDGFNMHELWDGQVALAAIPAGPVHRASPGLMHSHWFALHQSHGSASCRQVCGWPACSMSRFRNANANLRSTQSQAPCRIRRAIVQEVVVTSAYHGKAGAVARSGKIARLPRSARNLGQTDAQVAVAVTIDGMPRRKKIAAHKKCNEAHKPTP